MRKPANPSLLLGCLAVVLAIAAGAGRLQERQATDPGFSKEARAMHVQYLEIVTPDVDGTCAALGKMHGVAFGDPIPELGNARTASLKGGGRIGVRAPMHAAENSVVRPYMLVDDVKVAIEAAKAAGAEVAIESMEIPGQGTIGIYILGGIEHGLWSR